jgi:uncharacterized protein (TIGR02147 family)
MKSVYNYNDPIKYINDYISYQKESSEGFSVRKWSKTLGFSSPMTLIEIINGKKRLKGKASKLLIKGLDIDNAEKMFFQSIVERSLTSDEEKIKMYDLLVEELRPYGKEDYSCHRESTDLNLFSHWIYMAIFSLTNIPNFKISAESIKESLRIEVDESIIENALFDLFEKGLLIKKESGEVVAKYNSYSSKTDSTSKGVTDFYGIICDLAKQSLEIESGAREFQAFTVAIPQENVLLAKEIIRKARAQLVSLGNQEGKVNDTVYQANLMFFPLTKEVDLEGRESS